MRPLVRVFLLALVLPALAFAPAAAPVFHEYDVPTPGSRPHDPAIGADGALWYTGQMANKLGRLDPKSGEIKEFPLKTPESGPHGLVGRWRRQYLVYGDLQALRRQAES